MMTTFPTVTKPYLSDKHLAHTTKTPRVFGNTLPDDDYVYTIELSDLPPGLTILFMHHQLTAAARTELS